MRNLIINVTAIFVFTLVTFSFVSNEGDKKEIKIENSSVVWKGYKVTGAHQGTMAIESGHLRFSEDVLVGGECIIDMASIANTDLEGEYKGKLEGHLKSNDFFGVEDFPTATLIFKEVKASGKNSYEVLADLTIKGKTNPVTLDVSVYGNKANASMKIDRTKFDVRYGSTSFFDGLKDKAIYDDFDIGVDLEF